MINIAICDDDVYMTANIEQMLQEIGKEQHIQVNCDVFFDGSALLESLLGGSCYDLLYLDIEMEQLDGIDTANKIRQLGLPVLIVYVSGHERYLKRLFDTEPFRFVSKPVDKGEFISVFQAAYKRICLEPEYFSYINNKSLKKIPINSIAFFESSGRVVYIHETGRRMPDGKEKKSEEKFYGKINEVEEQLSATHGRFLRIHQSYLVNFDYIKSMTFTSVCMQDGTILQISKERQKNIRHEFCTLAGMEAMGGNRI